MNWWRDKTFFRTSRQRSGLVLLAFIGLTVTAWACGPYFPRWLLGDSDQSVQAVPVASFFKEIAAWRQGQQSQYKVVPPKDDQTQAQQVVDTELAELSEALRAMAPSRKAEVLAAQAQLRTKLKGYAEKLAEWQEDSYDWERNVMKPRPVFETVTVPAGLPPEFADYLKGSVAYYAGKNEQARAAWKGLLERPENERRYRSTWAAYMLGRMEVETAPEVAVGHFQKVRELAQVGYADSLGLAAASLGWEARAWLLQNNHRRAIELYLEQIAAGDKDTAMVSLRRTVERAFGHSDMSVRKLAEDAACRRVVTAALISQPSWTTPLINPDLGDATEIWLRILEERGAVEVELSEQLALAAYQAGKFELAERWWQRAPEDSATARWVHAKLLLRAGKLDEAAQELAGLARKFPVAEKEPGEGQMKDLLDRLEVNDDNDGRYDLATGRQEVHGELGVLQLSRRDFVSSLDCLIRGNFWADAAYVAERVLTTKELKTYVDRNHAKELPDNEDGISPRGNSLRFLLARRLARENQWTEAKGYFPADTRRLIDERQKLLATGHDPKLAAKVRAKALWEAAQLTSERGDVLFETVVEPDWNGGNYTEIGPSIEGRWQQQTNTVIKTSREELKRAADHEVAPRARKHYLFLAADIAWQAAELMPAQSEATAKVLYQAGGWIKYRDPKAANRFYRALVLRCNKTELGAVAEKLRWFPPLDENGKPYLPKRVPQAKVVEPVDSFPVF